jgi:hypothetical protein
MLYAKVAPTARRILAIGENRLLQQYRHLADLLLIVSYAGKWVMTE